MAGHVNNGMYLSLMDLGRFDLQYTIETRILGVDDKAIYFEQRIVADGEIYARAYVATRLVTKRGPVGNPEIFAEVGQPPVDLVLPEWIQEWRESNGLPGSRRSAPHAWAYRLTYGCADAAVTRPAPPGSCPAC